MNSRFSARARGLSTATILLAVLFGFYLAVYIKTSLSGEGGNPHLFFDPDNLSNLLGQAALVGTLASGMTLVIIAGQIDLSVGSLLGMLGAIVAALMSSEVGFGLNPLVSCLLVVLLGALLGAMHGALVAFAKIPAFIVTLGGLLAYRGVLLLVAERTIPVKSALINSLGSAMVPPTFAWMICFLLLTFIALPLYRSDSKHRGFSRLIILMFMVGGLSFSTYWINLAGVPLRFMVMLVVALFVHLLSSYMTFGRYLYAVGGNSTAARYSGVKVERILVGVFSLMGVIAAFSGFIYCGIQMAADPGAGDLLELYAIAACVIGGTSLTGGKGKVAGSILGALIMASIRNGLSCLGVSSPGEKIVLGVILVCAVGLDFYFSKKK